MKELHKIMKTVGGREKGRKFKQGIGGEVEIILEDLMQ